jgi:surface polysaccharide O-acyltransferase-like enzyme
MKTRNSQIELLRILAILGVVVLHYNGNVAFAQVNAGSIQQYILFALESLFLAAVNVFVLISGYFLYNSNERRWVKVLQLLVQVMALGVVRYALTLLLSGGVFSVTTLVSYMIPNNWFVTLYLALYILSPYLNLLIERLDEQQMRLLILFGIGLFSLWPTLMDIVRDVTGLSFIGLYPLSNNGNLNGYTIVQFVLMYLIGAYLHRFGEQIRIKNGWLELIFAGCVGLVTVWQIILPLSARAYSNPLIILMAICIFLLFSRIRLQSKAINLLARGAFSCYILHDVFLPHVDIEHVIHGNPFVLIGHVFACAIGIYLISFAIGFLYDLVSRPVLSLFGKWLTPLDRYISPHKE